ncbi:hypothetical protein GOBAR_AA11329 [Gossypium barbadense]|uniref:Uncharacterized protein n=1 Tax=Gossypium barbadense TaxID=3634 RepID=A0A2P5Y1C3_GOSBA|nr:hypothetical protein GOBAR_AA11329 [Gossypium barbadense]
MIDASTRPPDARMQTLRQPREERQARGVLRPGRRGCFVAVTRSKVRNSAGLLGGQSGAFARSWGCYRGVASQIRKRTCWTQARLVNKCLMGSGGLDCIKQIHDKDSFRAWCSIMFDKACAEARSISL